MSNENMQFLDSLDAVYDAVDDADLDQEARFGIQPPVKNVREAKFRVSQQKVRTRSGERTCSVKTWEEDAVIVKVGFKPVNENNELTRFHGLNMWIRTKIISDYGNKGMHPEMDFLRWYPGLIGLSEDQLEQIKQEGKDSGKDKHPFLYIKSRQIEQSQSARKMSRLLIATGYRDRLTKQGGVRLPAIADLLADDGKMLQDIPLRIVVQQGKPNYFDETPDNEVIDYLVAS